MFYSGHIFFAICDPLEVSRLHSSIKLKQRQAPEQHFPVMSASIWMGTVVRDLHKIFFMRGLLLRSIRLAVDAYPLY